jgi:hypothetical protein
MFCEWLSWNKNRYSVLHVTTITGMTTERSFSRFLNLANFWYATWLSTLECFMLAVMTLTCQTGSHWVSQNSCLYFIQKVNLLYRRKPGGSWKIFSELEAISAVTRSKHVIGIRRREVEGKIEMLPFTQTSKWLLKKKNHHRNEGKYAQAVGYPDSHVVELPSWNSWYCETPWQIRLIHFPTHNTYVLRYSIQ